MLPDGDDVPLLIHSVMTSLRDKITGKADKQRLNKPSHNIFKPDISALKCICYHTPTVMTWQSLQNFLNVFFVLFKSWKLMEIGKKKYRVNLSRQPPASQTSYETSAPVSLCM